MRPHERMLRQLQKTTRAPRDTVTEAIYRVERVADNGTLDLRVGADSDAIVRGVPTVRSYRDPTAGDRVVVRKRRRSWLVTAALRRNDDARDQ